MKKLKKIKLFLLAIIAIFVIVACDKDLYEEAINQDKEINIKQISLEKFNSKMRQMKNKPEIERFMVSSRNGSALSRTERTSEFEIITDDIKEITQGDYTSYTMYLKTPDTTNNIYNITIEEIDGNSSFFITKYIPKTYWLENKNIPFDGEIITYRESNTNSSGANTLQEYLDLIYGELYAGGAGGGGGISGTGNSSSTSYPYDCNGIVYETTIVTEIKCGCGHNWQDLLTGVCDGCRDYLPTYPSLSTTTTYQCIPISSNPSGTGNTSGGNTLGGGGSGSGTGTGSGGTSTGAVTGSITTIVDPTEECNAPRGDLNNDCILDADESNFVTFLDNLTLVQRQFINENNNTKMNVFNYLVNQNWSNESKIFVTQFIQNSILSGLNLDFEKSLKSPANIDFSEIDKTTPEGQKLDCIYQKLMQSASFKNLFVDTFGGPQTRLNVKFEIADNLPFNIYGNCRLTTSIIGNNVSYTNIIRINKSKLDNSISNIIIAQTILHESIHAYLNIKKINCNLGSTITELNGLDLQSLIGTFYQSFGCHIDVNGSPQSQHVFILDFMIPVFENTLSGIKDSLINQNHQTQLLSQTFYNPITNENESFNWNDFFQYIGLLGLQNTQTFQDNIQSDSLKFTKFNFYLSMANMATRNCN
jgi:hypothetical protein